MLIIIVVVKYYRTLRNLDNYKLNKKAKKIA